MPCKHNKNLTWNVSKIQLCQEILRSQNCICTLSKVMLRASPMMSSSPLLHSRSQNEFLTSNWKQPILRIGGKFEVFISIYLLSEADIAVRFFRSNWSIAHVPFPDCRTCFYLHKALGKVLSCIDWPVQGSLMCSCIDHFVFSWKTVLHWVHLKHSKEKVELYCRCLHFTQTFLWV